MGNPARRLFLLTIVIFSAVATHAAEEQLPPLAPISDTDEYLKLTPKLTKEEFQQFLARAEKGEPLAMDLVFFSWLNGFGTTADFNQARAWLARGNKVGAPLCRLYHGRNLFGFWLDLSSIDNKRGKKNLKQAESFFHAPAQEGNAAAQFFIAAALTTLQDPSAMEWYKRSAEQGFSLAQLNLGCSLCAGRGIPRDVDAGMRLLRDAADHGLAFAMVEMCDCCKRPETRNFDESLRWLLRAVECGYPRAFFKMALAYEDGEQVKEDQKEAQKFFLKAAEAGYPWAMITLADRYKEGKTFREDEVAARKWYRLASVVGYETGSYFAQMKEANRLLQEGKREEARAAAEEAMKTAEYELEPTISTYALFLHNIGHVYMDLGDLEKAEELHTKAIAMYRCTEDDRGLADALMCGSHIDELKGRWGSTETQKREALALLEKRYPKTNDSVVSCRYSLAEVLCRSHRFREALQLLDDVRLLDPDLHSLSIGRQLEIWCVYSDIYSRLRWMNDAEDAAKRALAIVPNATDQQEVRFANAHIALANVYDLNGRYADARKLFDESLQKLKEHYGEKHFTLSGPLISRGHLDEKFGHFGLAEAVYQEAISLRKEKGLDPSEVAYAVQSLAGLLEKTGRFSEAEDLFKTAINEQHTSEKDSWVISNNFGSLLYRIDRYQEAEALFKEALNKAEKQYGPEHSEIMTPLSNMARLYGTLGRFDEQKAFLDRRLAIATKVYGPDHIDAAWAYLELSYILSRNEQYAQALELQKHALAIFQKCYGEQGFKTLEIESELAVTYIQCGRFAEAEPILRKTLAAAEGIKGYTRLPEMRRKLALALQGLQRFGEAGKTFQDCLDGTRALYGDEHLDTANALESMASFLAATDRSREALSMLRQAASIEDHVTDQVSGFSSEEQRVGFAGTLLNTGHLILTLCLEQMADDPAARNTALDLLLHRQGAVLDSVQRERLAAREADDPALAETMTKRQRVAATLSTLTLAGPGNRDPKDYQAQLTDLQKQINELEAEWARKSTAFCEQTRQQQLTGSDLKQVLPADAAFVQIAAYRQKNFSEVAESKTWGPRQYAALILTKDAEAPMLVKLGAAEPIEKAIAACRAAAQKMTKPDEKTAGDEWLKTATELRKLVWDPLAEALKDRRKVYLVPDGELNFVAFGTLPLEDGRFLIEDREIAILSNGRDLLRQNVATKEGTVFALAAPEFGGVTTAQEEVAVARGLFRSHLAGRAGFDRLGAFSPLPGTLAEAKNIEALCKAHARTVEVHTGAEATEARLKSTIRPAVLHLATHGFFLPEPDEKQDKGKNASTVRNALLRSGLALAGANRIVKGEAPEPGQEDGLVTAEEVTGLDLWGTKLVVLSACQTALGESRGGEGVFGLRRAFLLAGAEHLLMSLWSVPDKETQELMVEFYKRYLEGASPGRALREAQLEYLRRARTENRSTHPFYWGAFVHTGIGTD